MIRKKTGLKGPMDTFIKAGLECSQKTTGEFCFLDLSGMIDGDMKLLIVQAGYKGPPEKQFIFYRFDMVRVADKVRMGGITLRIGDAARVLKYSGHIGFDVEPVYRGRRYAERSTRLLMPLARRHGLKELWIGCSEDNAASRKTCERLGAVLVEIVPVPEGVDLYDQGMRFLCRYCLKSG
jgi:predicted acetyltransferase